MDSGFPDPPNDERVAEALRRLVDARVDAPELSFEWREWRWIALAPPYTVFVAASAEGWSRLLLEADLIEAGSRTVGSLVPTVLGQEPSAWLQVREHRTGLSGWEIEERIFGIQVVAPPAQLPRYSTGCPLTGWGERFAAELGAALARLHQGMSTENIVARLEPEALDWSNIESVVREHAASELLVRACEQARAWDMERSVGRTALHGDPHLHNMFATTDGRLCGLIDFDGASVGDFHEDLRYLHSQGPRFAEIAMAAYSDEAGVDVDRRTVARLHTRSAFAHFSWVRPGAPRFPRIVAWATESVRALTPDWDS